MFDFDFFKTVFWVFQVHVQSDPAGRLVVSGQPEQPDNPWGVTAFKKVDFVTSIYCPFWF